MALPFLNIDAGEMDDEAEELFSLAHVVNIACGGHAGDDASIALALMRCSKFGTRVGAHPAYPDRSNFGRTTMVISAGELESSLHVQCARLRDAAAHAQIEFVKPHGALYHDANRSEELANALCRAITRTLARDITIIGRDGGALAHAAHQHGFGFAREGFADRGMKADGSLIPRGEPGAMIEDPVRAAAQARKLSATVDTVCVHADTAGSLAIARAVRKELDA